MMNTLLTASNISVKAAGKVLLNNISFELSKGQNWAIAGKSGAGKTVLLQTLAGNFGVSAGSISYNFMHGNANPERTTHHNFIAFAGSKHHFKNLSNTTQLYYQQRYNSSDSEDALTVTEYLQTVKANTHAPAYWTFNKTIAALNLTALSDKQIIKLSNGETKRLMIAAALLKNPVILLLDNPMTGLDVQTRASFNILLTEISASGISIIMATSAHDIPDVVTHIALMDNGAITKTARKEEFNPADLQPVPAAKINTNHLQELLNPTATPSFQHIVRMKEVFIQYGDKVVLNKINWEINQGERWALLGANGAGKSTLLSLINGDNPQAYANDIVLFDKKRGTGESIWDIKSKIGFVSPELYQYFPTDNSCLQVIESGFYDTLGLFRQSVKSQADLALKWMQALEIEQYARVLLKNIPASAQRLCLLARALIKNPALLIFDEPCQGLDDHQQQHFKQVVDAVCSLSNVTLIYVTHYQHEIPESVDKVLRLDKGEVVL
jgi:molybdate transport system ATP-binding protein